VEAAVRLDDLFPWDEVRRRHPVRAFPFRDHSDARRAHPDDRAFRDADLRPDLQDAERRDLRDERLQDVQSCRRRRDAPPELVPRNSDADLAARAHADRSVRCDVRPSEEERDGADDVVMPALPALQPAAPPWASAPHSQRDAASRFFPESALRVLPVLPLLRLE
jgi:hypothetical protein